MNRPPPSSTPFPYPTLSRSCEPGPVRISLRVRTGRVQSLRTYVAGRWVTPPRDAAVTDLGTVSARDAVDTVPRSVTAARSEGQTSELQSQSNIVCRLLLGDK